MASFHEAIRRGEGLAKVEFYLREVEKEVRETFEKYRMEVIGGSDGGN